MKTIQSALFIFILSSSLLGLMNCEHAPEGLLTSDLQPTKAALGPFTISIENDSKWMLKIYSEKKSAADTKLLWSSVRGRSFITAGHGEPEIKESRGSFKIKDRLTVGCKDQTITQFEVKPDQVNIRGELSCTGKEPLAPYQMRFTLSGSMLRFEARIESKEIEINRVFLTLSSTEDEGIFGFGEQFTHFNQKGKLLPILVQEQGVGRGAQPVTLGADLTAGAGGDWHTTYIGVPQFISTAGRGFFLENYEYSIFDLRKDDRMFIEVFSPTMTGRFLSPGTPLDLIEQYTSYSGRMRPLPDWAHKGAIVGLQGGTNEAKRAMAELDTLKTPVAALWLQDWVGQRVTNFGKQLWWNWELDQDRYPGWDALVANLKLRDVRVMTYVNPFIADVAEKKGNVRRNLFAEAKERGYLIKHKDGSPYLILNTDFYAAMLDLTNPEARRWMKEVIKKEVIGTGSSGWMADFGEALPFDAQLFSGEAAASYHNRYPEEWATLNREAIAESGKTDLVYFCRSGYARSPGNTSLFWLGDQLVTWDEYDGMKSSIAGLLSGGISGFTLNHGDIGGYTTITNPLKNYHRSRELMLRWIELGAFQTVFRTHEGNRPDVNHQFNSDPDTLKHFSRFAKIHAAWFDYRKKLMEDAATHGWPIQRHLYLHYPNDIQVRRMRFEEFLVGTELLVAPVTEQGQKKISVYFPPGKWIHLWTGDVHGSDNGNYAIVDAPIGQPAVFYRQGSAVGEAFRKSLNAQGLL